MWKFDLLYEAIVPDRRASSGGNICGGTGYGLPLQRVWDDPGAPVILLDFWNRAYGAIDD